MRSLFSRLPYYPAVQVRAVIPLRPFTKATMIPTQAGDTVLFMSIIDTITYIPDLRGTFRHPGTGLRGWVALQAADPQAVGLQVGGGHHDLLSCRLEEPDREEICKIRFWARWFRKYNGP